MLDRAGQNRLSGKRIAEARRAAGLSQSQLAARAGVESQTISLYERGRVTPGADALLLIAKACGVDPQWLRAMDQVDPARTDPARTGTDG